MEVLNIVSSIASIVSLLLTIFVVQKVTKIGNEVSVKGSSNITVGGNAKL